MWNSTMGKPSVLRQDDKHAITRSPGVGLPEDQMTLKDLLGVIRTVPG